MSDKIRQKDKNNISVYIQGGEKKVMTKFNKKMINVLATATLVAGVAAPIAALTAPTAIHASSSYSVLTTPTINSAANTNVELGRVKVNVGKASVKAGSSFTVTLPKGFEFKGDKATAVVGVVGAKGVQKNGEKTDWGSVSGATYGSDIYGLGVYVDGDDNKIDLTEPVLVQSLSSNSVRIEVKADNPNDDLGIYLNFANIKANSPSTGPVKVAIDAASDSGLTSGEVTVANVVSSGQVSLAAADTVSASEDFTFTLKAKEATAKSLKSNNTIKLKLPSGFKWSSIPAQGTNNSVAARLYGDLDTSLANLNITGVDTDTLTIAPLKESSVASAFNLKLAYKVDDESSAKKGDVTANITGTASTDVGSLVVGNYGEYGGGVSVEKPTTILAGQDEQRIGDISIKETIAGSIRKDRTVTLRLPEGARWQSPFKTGSSDFVGTTEYANGMSNVEFDYSDSDKRTLRIKFKNDTTDGSDPGKLILKNVEVATQPGFSGDLNVEVAGSQGFTGSVKVATVKKAVTLAAASKPTLTIGLGDQQLGDITITEAAREALTKKNNSSGQVVLELPIGVRFATTPEVKVTSGDLKIKSVSTDTYGDSDKGRLSFYIDSESSTPSTITISAPKVVVDRTVAQGDIVAKLKGEAASYTAYKGNGTVTQNWKDNNTAADEIAIATIGTPAPGATKTKAVFTLGSTSYTVNGETKTADVAAYAQNGRTYLPVRYAAEALGVSPQNILFDKSTSTVTLIKGDRVAQIKLNTNLLTVNGSVIRMDVKAVTNKNRTVLPIFWVSRALDASINYDATAKTVTVENNN
ncbi:copper amine oxidase [Paenibacillus jamilae]|uniref:copper amine oxidase N-terminal domain-containing protein n=1 Tax=Paenibacillus jamilae TaxID=114136 RepID=UPI0007AB56FC|nr:copper amine oxidase N-terminal domain-containing protein [Paenibacillus jamilae]KZE70216.1 copper amine oxidase [Paenibacillus jamilae]